MGFFTRKSKWDHLVDAATKAVQGRRFTQSALGAVSGLAGATAISAAVSAMRERGKE